MKAQTIMTLTMGLLGMSAHALEGREVGNGGDLCEARIQSISADLRTWIEAGGGESLSFPAGTTSASYRSGMIDQIQQAVASCSDKPLRIGSLEKVCINYFSNDRVPRIVCDRAAFMNGTTESQQYVLIHHGFAGLSGFEVNQGEISNYELSNQLNAFLTDTVVKKLKLKPSLSNTSYDHLELDRLPVKIRFSFYVKPQLLDVNQSIEIGKIAVRLGYNSSYDARCALNLPSHGIVQFSGGVVSTDSDLQEEVQYGPIRSYKIIAKFLIDGRPFPSDGSMLTISCYGEDRRLYIGTFRQIIEGSLGSLTMPDPAVFP